MRYFVLLFALLSFVAPARAMDCASLARVRTDVLRWDFPVSVTPMDAKASVAFISAYNREPPTSNLEGDLVAVISNPEKPTVVVVIFKDGCAAFTLFFPKQKFINLIAGDRI